MSGILWPSFWTGFVVVGFLIAFCWLYLRPRMRVAWRQGDHDGLNGHRDHDYFRGIYRLAYEHGHRDTDRMRARIRKAGERHARNQARQQRRQAKRATIQARRNR